jgi:CheY-like chemotaxis protein
MSSGGESERRVLIVEDDPDVAGIVAVVLRAAGFDPVVAADGREGLERLRETHPSVVLLDLMMPGMTGWQFREAQLRDPELARVPIVVVSGAGKTPAHARDLGADAYLTKPIELDDLLQVVGQYAA